MSHGLDLAKPKKPYYGRSHTPRTRSGCLGCRRRKLKCDEQKPRCLRCSDGNQSCQYGLKLTWKSEVFSGKAVRQASQPFQTNPWIGFLNTNTEDLAVYEDTRTRPKSVQTSDTETIQDNDGDDGSNYSDHEKIEEPLPSCSSLVKLSSPLRCSPVELSSADSILLDFYVNRMCSTCTLLDGYDNGYKHVIIPILTNSPLLMKSVLAVAANHLRFLDSRYHITALRYRGSTLKSLQRLISNPWLISKSELLSTILMLCFFDISDGCQSDWLKHLKGAKRIMLQPSSTEDAHSNTSVITFLAQYFASHNIMACTALADPSKGKALQTGGEFWLRQIIRPEQEIDCVVGCSKELMGIILEISNRVREARNPQNPISEQDISEQLAWKHAMELRLHSLEQNIPVSSNTTSSRAARLQYTASAFRDASMILLQYLDPQQSSSSNIKTRQCVTNIISLLDECPIDPSGSRSSSLWPLFIAACHVVTDEERLFMLKRFHSMESRKRFGNISPVREVVECVWRRRDLRADDVGRKKGENGNGDFEWETAMAFLGSNLSLT